ncbi:MAG: DUF1015 domain-containing protein [Elusimicrobia bacterium]|nr:DUF1015 domain-containing protein [Elusimicrobiota bacterium]
MPALMRPFRGVRYDRKRVAMDRAVCPPYDVIGARLADRLRRLPFNAIHLELPSGNGDRYRKAGGVWRRWNDRGIVRTDHAPAYYVVEQAFAYGGRRYVRTGVLCALDLRRAGPRTVRRHEKTLSKPKADRLKQLAALKVNTSPIFGLFRDAGGAVRALLRRAKSARSDEAGTSSDGSRFKVWRVDEPSTVAALERALGPKTLLIADGHHRFEVAKEYFRRTKTPATSTMLVYVCAEEDAGLLVLPTHRVVSPPGEAQARARERCRLTPKPGLTALLEVLDAHPSPYAFGLFEAPRAFWLAVPKSPEGAKSGLCVEYLARSVTSGVDPHHLKYTHEAAEAVRLARESKGAALLVKPASVADIRRAVERIGLLPQKSTYFFPKITTGLVFKPLA